MRVDSVSPEAHSICKCRDHGHRKPRAEETEPKLERVACHSSKDRPADKGTEHDEDRARGVIRLLEEGHFNGVAELRLRINFFDELSARAETQARELLADGVESLTDTVTGEAEGVLAGLGLNEQAAAVVPELIDAFREAAEKAVKEAVGDGGLTRDTIETALRDSFAAFLNDLRALTAPPEPPAPTPQSPPVAPEGPAAPATVEPVTLELTAIETPVGAADAPAVEIDGPVEMTQGAADAGALSIDGTAPDTEVPPQDSESDADASDPFNSLQTVFDTALAALLESLESAFRLPDPSQPRGQGVAFDKFLATYNSLRDGFAAGGLGGSAPAIDVSG